MQFHRMKMRNWYAFKGEQELVFPKEGLANIMVVLEKICLVKHRSKMR